MTRGVGAQPAYLFEAWPPHDVLAIVLYKNNTKMLVSGRDFFYTLLQKRLELPIMAFEPYL